MNARRFGDSQVLMTACLPVAAPQEETYLRTGSAREKSFFFHVSFQLAGASLPRRAA
jgi:hypothetical protein